MGVNIPDEALLINTDLSEDDFNKYLGAARVYLAKNYSYWASAVLGCKIVKIFKHEEFVNAPAFTDGQRTIYFNITNLGKYLDYCYTSEKGKVKGPFYSKEVYYSKGILFLLLHELFHCVYLHALRKDDRDALIWNISGDIVINIILSKVLGYSIPYMLGLKEFNEIVTVVKEEEFMRSYTTEVVYNLLIKSSKLKYKQKGSSGDGKKGGKGPHESSSSKSFMDRYGDSGDISFPATNEMSHEEQERWKNYWMERSTLSNERERTAGIIPGLHFQELNEIYEAKIDWREALSKLVSMASNDKEDYSWSKRSRKSIGQEVFLPSLYSNRSYVVFAVDTSGSMSDEEITRAISEAKGICETNNAELYFIMFDTDVQYESEIGDEYDLPKKAFGRGGTMFGPVLKRINELYENGEIGGLDLIVMFTDGYNADQGFEKEVPFERIMWLLTTPSRLNDEVLTGYRVNYN